MQTIDVKAAKEYVMANYLNDPLLKHMAIALLEQLPKVEAVEVVHGQWYCGCVCSECGEDLSSWADAYYETNYCPNCGAKMDGDSE